MPGRRNTWVPSPRSGRQHKAWGEAQRNPRIKDVKTIEPAERPIADTTQTRVAAAVSRSADFDNLEVSVPGV